AAGRLRVSRAGDTIAAMATGDVVDPTGSLPGPDRLASVTAETDCRILVLPAALVASLAGAESARLRLDALVPERQGSPSSKESEGAGTEEAGAVLQWRMPEYHPPPRFLARLRRLPAVRQQSTMDCGAACLATLCRYYG